MAGTSKLARYRYIRSLGSGGMGIVSLAEDTLLARLVALKRVSAMGGDQGPLRLRREALVGASVSHPNLVSIYDIVDSEDGDVVIVMEYVEGETLRATMTRQGQLPREEALRILAGAAAGLDAIHEQGIVHRDVKPANILLGSDGTVKVADLGIASVADRTRITTSGSVLGSLGYMAPEQLGEAPATPATDVYALAAVAYEALSGEKARKEANAVALAYAVSSQPPPALDEAWPSAPAAATALLCTAMARDPSQRPRSAGELVARLEAALEPAGTASPTAVPTVEREAPISAAPLPPAAAAPPPRGAAEVDVGEPIRAARSASTADRAPRTRPVAARSAGAKRARWWALAPVLAVAAVAVIAVTALGGASSSNNPSHQAAPAAQSSHPSSVTTSSSPATSQTSTSRTASGSGTPVATRAPVSAVESFYRLAAAHRYPQAWALADPSFQSQLGGYQSFQGGFAADKSITFESARVVNQASGAATVSVTTTSVRTDGTKHCTGTVELRSGGSSAPWLLHQIQISCA